MQKLLIVTICLLTIISCRKDIAPEPCQNPLDPNCANYHPCNGVLPTSAAFTMEEVVNAPTNGWPTGDRIVYDTDTCRNWNNIVFTCTQKADSIWWIFDDTEMRPEWQQKQSFSIRFGSPGGPLQTEPERVKITCVVKNNKPNPCFPDDSGIDTFTRYMVYMPWWQTGFIGRFRGSFTYKPDSVFDFEIWWDSITIPSTSPRYFIRYDKFLTVPPFYTTDFSMEDGFEFSKDISWGYSAFYLDFFATGFPAIPQKYNYLGVTHRGKVMFNPRTRQLKIDFVRGGKGQDFMRQWPPLDRALLTFIGTKL